MLQHNTQDQDAAEVQRMLQQLETANSVSRGMLMPVGKTGSLESVERVLGFVPGCLKVFSAGGQQQQTLFDADFKHGLRDATAPAYFWTAWTYPPS